METGVMATPCDTSIANPDTLGNRPKRIKKVIFLPQAIVVKRTSCVYLFVMNMFATAATADLTRNSAGVREAQELVRQESLEIAQGLKRQDPGLLDILIQRYQHRLLRYLLYLTSNREQAEDIFQEVWMRVLVRGGQFNGKARFDTWLFTVARNLVIDLRRKRTMSSLDEMFEAYGEDDRPSAIEIADETNSPFDQYAGGEDRQRLASALMQMEPLYREVLVLRFHEDLSLEEIANVTRAPLSTVKSRLYRGLASMKPKLESYSAPNPAAAAGRTA
jgi:RNA polymerase sigma-70 factor, ECF subfamily